MSDGDKPETCERCKGSGWCWWDELDNYAGHDPTNLVTDDTRYSCPDCDGSGESMLENMKGDDA